MKATAQEPLVSIITPVYNAASFLEETFQSVLNQKYQNWEWILVDDVSTDASIEIIRAFQGIDSRVKLVKNKKNSKAAISRNNGVDQAKGRFIAFLDADDLWVPGKLDGQVSRMLSTDSHFSYTGYEFTERSGQPTGKKVVVPDTVTYAEALKRSPIFTSTVVVDVSRVKREHLIMPNYLIGEDTAMWWNLLRNYGPAQGLPEVLAYYRRGSADTLSANKLEASKWRWFLYRSHEKMGILNSTFYFVHYLKYAVERRV